MRVKSLMVVATVVVALFSGCSDGDEKHSVELNTTGSAPPTPSESPASDVPEVPPAEGLARGLDPASTPDEQQVTDTWFRYWAELTRMYSEVSVDRTVFDELARGQAYKGPVAYVERLESSGNRNQGGSIASVEKLTVSKDRAVVTGCQRTGLIEVDAEGVPAELPTPFVRTKETFERDASGWVVVGHQVISTTLTTCSYR